MSAANIHQFLGIKNINICLWQERYLSYRKEILKFLQLQIKSYMINPGVKQQYVGFILLWQYSMPSGISFSKSKHFNSSPFPSFFPLLVSLQTLNTCWKTSKTFPAPLHPPYSPIRSVPCHRQEWDFDFLIERFFSWLRLCMCVWEMPQLHSPSISSSLDLWLCHHFTELKTLFRHHVSQWWHAAMGNIIHMVLHPALLLGFTPNTRDIHLNIPSLLIKTPS